MLNLVTNTYKNFIMNARIRKSLRKWAADEAFIRLKLGGKKYSSGARFTWCVLIPQEIAAWIIRGDKTAPKREFEWLWVCGNN